MFRRDFLKSLAAVAAGMAAAARSGELAAAIESSPAKKPISVTASAGAGAGGFRADLCDAQRQVLDLIKDCTVVSFSRSGPMTYTVSYEHRDGLEPQRTPFTDAADRLAAIGKPLSMSVSTEVDVVDVTHLGELKKFNREQVAHRVEIEWITTGEEVL